MNRISTKKSDTAKGPSRISTSTGSRSKSSGSTAGSRRTGPDPMPKVAVRDAPVRWPLQGTGNANYNKATKVPVIKTTVVGHGFA